jgi:hypothetical protein
MEAHSAACEERYDTHIAQSSAQIAQLQSELAAAKQSAAAATAEAQVLPASCIHTSRSTSLRSTTESACFHAVHEQKCSVMLEWTKRISSMTVCRSSSSSIC